MNLEDEEGFLENQVGNQKRNIRDWDESKQTESLKIIKGNAVKWEENNLTGIKNKEELVLSCPKKSAHFIVSIFLLLMVCSHGLK